ncbi:hypothetical protein ACHAW6_006989 [Cyclotella cf. meneghiniana]
MIKKSPWHLPNKHQEAFEGIKCIIPRDILRCSLAILNCKLSAPQTKYTVMELELLTKVECLMEFKSMQWVQCI